MTLVDEAATIPALLRAAAAVIGVPGDRMGEVGMAFVVPRPGADVEPDTVVAFARDRLANYKVPRSVIVVDELPVNASGKVAKHVLRHEAMSSTGGSDS